MSSSYRCNRFIEEHDKRDLIEVSTLIDLTDKPIGLTRDEIGWAKVKATSSNCICCCNNNSVTLVTTNNSYILDHVPIDNIQFAQTNASLQYLALSNHRKLVIIDLDADNDCINNNLASGSKLQTTNNINHTNETKVVNLAAYGLTMNDVILWRWIEDNVLAILSYEALYTCCVDQQHINHPAYTAFSTRSRYLSMQKVVDCHQYLSELCQATDIKQDITGNLFAISSLYSTSSLIKLNSSNNNNNNNTQATNANNNNNQQQQTSTVNTSNNLNGGSTKPLKSNFGSMPSRLSQLATSLDHSFDSSKSEHLFDPRRSLMSQATAQQHNQMYEDEVCGLIQVYCKIRNRTQLIHAHAITFTNAQSPSCSHDQKNFGPTILIAANKIGNQMRVHFIEMATTENHPSSASQNASPTIKFNRLTEVDFPTSIVCSHVNNPNNDSHLHVAIIVTKYGQLFVCSVAHSTILFNTSITSDIISSTVLEDNTQGLIVICRNGQVLLVKLKLAKLLKLLDESKTLRHISSSHNMLNSVDVANNNSIILDQPPSKSYRQKSFSNLGRSLDIGLEEMISTKL